MLSRYVRASLLLLTCVAAMRNTPAQTQTSYPLLEGVSYSRSQAQKQWIPTPGGSAVTVDRIDGTDALTMPCAFKGNKLERCSWDCDVKMDLRAANGIQFLMRCPDAGPIRSWTVYLRSGTGWYAHRLDAPNGTSWQPVKLRKSDFGSEGTPAGWGKVNRIRISAWRGGNANTKFHIARLGLIPSNARVAIIQAQSAGSKSRSTVQQYCAEMAIHLEALGIESIALSDQEVRSIDDLTRYKLLILPYNPAMPAAAVNAVTSFARNGGKLMAFYNMPAALQPLIGVKVGNYLPGKPTGRFARIRSSKQPLPGAPTEVIQGSWNIMQAQPLPGKARVAAWWCDSNGKQHKYPAIIAGPGGVYLSHVLMKDDLTRKRDLLLAMVGELVPAFWQQAATSRIAAIGALGDFTGYAQTRSYILTHVSRRPNARKPLEHAAEFRANAVAFAHEKKYPQAIVAARRAAADLLDAYCLVQPSRQGEFRAFWCHSAFGLEHGLSWDAAIKRLADNGFTAIVPNMCWGGVAFYPSKVLPVHPSVKERGDQVAQCLAACRKYGIECHVWKVNFNMGWASSQATASKMAAAGRVVADAAGTKKDRWLSPAHLKNQELEIRAMVELARNYAIDGIHFDYIRYPGSAYCYNKESRRRFELAAGKPVANWPADVLDGGALRTPWLAFRRAQVTRVVEEVAKQARAVRKDIKISAAVFTDWPTHRDSIGQDWKVWCDKGYLDFVCPMDYTASNAAFGRMVEKQIKWAGKVPVYPGIGLSTWREATDAIRTMNQIKVARSLNAPGFIIFNYGFSQAEEVLPRLGMGITKRAP